MTITNTDLGTAVCRSIMRDLDDKPLAVEVLRSLSPVSTSLEMTTAAERSIAQQWTVILLPTLDFVSVRANLKYWGLGLWDLAVLNPDGGSFDKNLFVRYPSDPSLITGPEYEVELRAAVEKALAAVDADRERIAAERAGKAG